MTTEAPLRLCLFGVSAPANLGLDALRRATVAALAAREPIVDLTVFDDHLGVRRATLPTAGGPLELTLCGARNSRRFHRPEAYLRARVSAALGGGRNPTLARIDAADAVLDLSGGDSFSDLYGPRRFRTVAWPKRLALLRRRPLVLLPQTYGPFQNPRLRSEAAALVRRCAIAWARDPDSFTALRELLGADFDPVRHREGVDVAFALPPREPDQPARDRLANWSGAGSGPLVGVNVSGLLLGGGGERFGLRADVWRVVLTLCQRLLSESDARILLVPHVRTTGADDDDISATDRLRAVLAERHSDRVAVIPPDLAADQVKWVLSQLDWFVGMRMHATIAALSSGVATAGVAYSMKMRGVFATVGQEKQVADARNLSGQEMLETLWGGWLARADAAAELAAHLPGVVARARRQFDEVVTTATDERVRRGRGL